MVEDLLGVSTIDLCARSKDHHLGMHIEISEHALKHGNEFCEDKSSIAKSLMLAKAKLGQHVVMAHISSPTPTS